MFGKLLKYELMSTGRGMVLIWGAALVFSIASGVISVFISEEDDTAFNVFVICLILYVVLLLILILLLFVNIIKSFYKAMYGDEAYLAHMIPAKPWEQILSRLTVSVIWLAVTLAVLFLSIMILGFFMGFFGALSSPEVSAVIDESFGTMTAKDTANVIIASFLSFIRFTLEVCAAVLIGGCALKHKALFGFIAYFGMNIIINIFYSLTGLTNTMTTVIDSSELIFNVSGYTYSWTALLSEAVLAVIFFFVSKYFLKKRFNLT